MWDSVPEHQTPDCLSLWCSLGQALFAVAQLAKGRAPPLGVWTPLIQSSQGPKLSQQQRQQKSRMLELPTRFPRAPRHSSQTHAQEGRNMEEPSPLPELKGFRTFKLRHSSESLRCGLQAIPAPWWVPSLLLCRLGHGGSERCDHSHTHTVSNRA